MPDYALKCTQCSHRFEAFHAMKDPHPPCPQCAAAAETDFSQARAVPRVHGDTLVGRACRSLEYAAAPHEVGELRRLFGKAGHCWQSDGSVRWNSKSEARDFIHTNESLRRGFAEQKADPSAAQTAH